MICAIFATDASGAFAYDNGLPWPRNKEDMNFFKTLTTNQVVVMGRSTWDSKDMLRPLPNRTNIVVTNKPLEQPDIMTVSGDIPTILDGMFGPIFRTVSSIDGSIEMFRTDPGTWVSITKSTTFKYNKRPYFWYLNGYLYCPNIDWDAIRVEAIFEGKIDTCDTDECMVMQDTNFALPEYLFSEVEQFVIKELTMSLSVPSDGPDDSQNALR
jgi:hypothetical protein